MSFFDATQTPIWDESIDYVIEDIPNTNPIKKAKAILKTKEDLAICVEAGICMKCGKPLTKETHCENCDDSIDTVHHSCKDCKIRYGRTLY